MAKSKTEKQPVAQEEKQPETTAVATVAAPSAPAVVQPDPEFIQRMKEAAEALESFQGELRLPVIRFKEGFTFNEGEEPVESFDGVIVHTKQTNIFYSDRYKPGSAAPPTCFSLDGVTPNHPTPVAPKCATCPKNQWGSAGDSAGKACKNTRPIFIITPGAVIPRVLRVPPTSLPIIKNFVLNAVTDHGSWMNVLTRFSVFKKQESQTHWNIRAEVVRRLDPKEKVEMQLLRHTHLQLMQEINVGLSEEEEAAAAGGAAPQDAPHPADGGSGAQF
jgi:hypothetical protein